MKTPGSCRHIHTVESLLIPQDPNEGTVSTVPGRIPDGVCPKCRIAARRDGWNRNRGGGGQRYGCARCGLRFSEKFGFEWQTLAPDLVVDVLDTHAGGMSIRTIADHISRRIRDGKDARRTVSRRTVHRIITRYAHILGTFEDSLHPHVSEKRVDRRHDDRDGGPQKVPAFHHRRLHPVLESGIVTVRKDTDDVSPMFWDAKGRARKVPAVLVSDKDGTYHSMGGGVQIKEPPAKDHVTRPHIHANGDRNNNMMERFNGRLRARDQDYARQGGRHLHGAAAGVLQPHTPAYGPRRRDGARHGGGHAGPGRAGWTVLIRHARLHGIR